MVRGLPFGADGCADESMESLSAAGGASMPVRWPSWLIAREVIPAARLWGRVELGFPETSTELTSGDPSHQAEPPERRAGTHFRELRWAFHPGNTP